jgi:hypothetical protein
MHQQFKKSFPFEFIIEQSRTELNFPLQKDKNEGLFNFL